MSQKIFVSAQEVAEKAGVSRSAVSVIEQPGQSVRLHADLVWPTSIRGR